MARNVARVAMLLVLPVAVMLLVFGRSRTGRLSWPEMQVDVPVYRAAARFDEKIWLHRVNSVERARAVQERYRGLEIDVHYSPALKCFDVGHDVQDTIGLCLQKLLDSLRTPEAHYYWLDLKNLSAVNVGSALEELDRISRTYARADRFIIESDSPQLLAAFTTRGFFTSYYLPTFQPDSVSPAVMTDIVQAVAANLRTSRVNAISGYHFQYDFMRHYFPKLDYLLWDLSGQSNPVKRREILDDPRVKVLLVPESSPGYR